MTSFYDSKIFRDRSQICVKNYYLQKFFLKKKQNNFRPKRVKIGNNLIKNPTSLTIGEAQKRLKVPGLVDITLQEMEEGVKENLYVLALR